MKSSDNCCGLSGCHLAAKLQSYAMQTIHSSLPANVVPCVHDKASACYSTCIQPRNE